MSIPADIDKINKEARDMESFAFFLAKEDTLALAYGSDKACTASRQRRLEAMREKVIAHAISLLAAIVEAGGDEPVSAKAQNELVDEWNEAIDELQHDSWLRVREDAEFEASAHGRAENRADALHQGGQEVAA